MTEYVPLVLGMSAGHTPHDIEEFRKRIALQCQGESVLVRNAGDCITQAISFAVLYNMAAEVVVETKSGRSILCFDHYKL